MVEIANDCYLSAGEVNTVQCIFELPDEYKGLTVMAKFTYSETGKDEYTGLTVTEDKTVPMQVADGVCELPHEAMVNAGMIKIGITAYELDGDTVEVRYSPTPVKKVVYEGSTTANGENSGAATPTLFEQQVAEMQGYLNSAQAAANNATASKNAAATAEANAKDAQTAAEEARDEADVIAEKTALAVVDTRAPAIIQTASGEVISVNDSADAGFQGLKVFGKTEQVTTTGKNLLENSVTTISSNGVDFTVNSDKSIRVRGTATGTAQAYLNYNLLPNGSYIMSGGNVTRLVAAFRKKDGTIGYISQYGNNDYSFTVTDNFTSSFTYLQIMPGETVDETVYPMIRLASVEDATYEPYTGGAPSPSPDYPQELVSVGADGEIGVNSPGKNLIEFGSYMAVENYQTLVWAKDTSAIREGKTYTISVDLEADDNTRAYWATSSGLIDEIASFDVSAGKKRYSHTFVAASDGMLSVSNQPILSKSGTGDGITITPSRCQIEEGSVATEYEPFENQSLPISTPNGLPGIPVTSGGNYTDENGQQWICDEIDFGRGKYIQRTLLVSGFEKGSTYTNTTIFTKGTGKSVVGGSNHAALCSITDVYGYDQLDYIHYYVSTAGSVNVYASASFDNTNDVIKALIALATPIETDLPTEQIEAYKALHSNYPSTTVMNDEGAGMEVKYVADTKTYIDNKFAELANTILSNV